MKTPRKGTQVRLIVKAKSKSQATSLVTARLKLTTVPTCNPLRHTGTKEGAYYAVRVEPARVTTDVVQWLYEKREPPYEAGTLIFAEDSR